VAERASARSLATRQPIIDKSAAERRNEKPAAEIRASDERTMFYLSVDRC
jgi:hypothetical protein